MKEALRASMTASSLRDDSGWKGWVLSLLIPLAYPLALVVLWVSPKNFGFGHRVLVYAGWGIGLSGLALWILAMVHLGRALAVLPGAPRLVTHGVYRFLRHPVYLGITLTLLGLVLCLGSLWGLFYLGLLVLPLNLWRARWEERVLRAQFGEAYETWRRRTWF